MSAVITVCRTDGGKIMVACVQGWAWARSLFQAIYVHGLKRGEVTYGVARATLQCSKLESVAVPIRNSDAMPCSGDTPEVETLVCLRRVLGSIGVSSGHLAVVRILQNRPANKVFQR